jgi:hypothetical protein
VHEEFGTVIGRERSALRVRTASGEWAAGVATSCLVTPSSGDRVLVVRSGDECYVLAVLAAARTDETDIVLDGDVSLRVSNGKLRFFAAQGVEVASPEGLDVRAARVEAQIGRGRVGFSLLELVGESIVSKTNRVRILAEAVDTVAGRIYERTVHFLRRTDELDRVEAKSIERRADRLVHIHGENAVTTAEHLVKIDGSQVHVG